MLSDALLATERHHATQRRASRTALIRRLCAQPGEPAPELAISLGLPMSVVAPLLRQLADEGMVLERRERGSGARRALPRYRLDGARLALLGADVGVERARVVATSFSGRVLAATTATYGRAASAMTCVDALASALLRVGARLGADGPRIVGMGLGLPGALDEPAGDARPASFLRARDVPLGALLARELAGSPLDGTPIFAGRAADVAALGEFEFGPGTGRRASLLYLDVDEELHAGIILDGALLTGRRGVAGDVGHSILQVDGPRCACGRTGCAQALIGARSLAGAGPADPVRALRRRLEAGSADTAAAVARAGACLGTLLHNLAVVYRPSRIVLGGSMVGLGDALLGPARQAMGDGPVVLRGRHALSVSSFGAEATAVGAAALARYRLTGRLDGAMPGAAPRAEAAQLSGRFFCPIDLSLHHHHGHAVADP